MDSKAIKRPARENQSVPMSPSNLSKLEPELCSHEWEAYVDSGGVYHHQTCKLCKKTLHWWEEVN